MIREIFISQQKENHVHGQSWEPFLMNPCVARESQKGKADGSPNLTLTENHFCLRNSKKTRLASACKPVSLFSYTTAALDAQPTQQYESL